MSDTLRLFGRQPPYEVKNLVGVSKSGGSLIKRISSLRIINKLSFIRWHIIDGVKV